MPMDRTLYPPDWDEIAFQIKEAAGWRCVKCDRPCRRTGESIGEFLERIDGERNPFIHELPRSLMDEGDSRLGRFTLTVAHLNHNPADCDPSNLRAWCSVCHCRYDLAAMPLKKRLKQERLGQLSLLPTGGDIDDENK
ncbi:MAG: hypothetical protein WBA57_08690 [Elainellaceae cyanobacterium]